jgi:pyruvate/2-oxoglutarate dehydrogenase complex dihydrolipoamide dehydrogenase (E3) component
MTQWPMSTTTRSGGLDLIEGEAHFTGPKTVEVALPDGGTRQISAPVVVIDTGTRPRLLTITGAGEVPVLDSTSLMELDELPEHLIILGGGYIGLEFGQMFRRFGSEVTIIQAAARLMMPEDDDVSGEVATILRDDGITVLTSAMPVRVEAADGGRLRLTVRGQDGERQVEGSHLLSAIGRVPNTEALAPEAAGIRLDDHGFIEVDEYLETSVPGVHAMGDVKGGPAFTHLSYDDYRILHANFIEHEKASTRDRIVPYTVFIDPELGRVGLTEREARAQGRAIRVAKLPMSAVIRAIETGETRGFMKAIVDADSGQILGCAVLGSEGCPAASGLAHHPRISRGGCVVRPAMSIDPDNHQLATAGTVQQMRNGSATAHPYRAWFPIRSLTPSRWPNPSKHAISSSKGSPWRR